MLASTEHVYLTGYIRVSTIRRAELVFWGGPEGGQGRGWCRKVGGDMGHKQLRIGVQGGLVEHRGERRVRVVQKEDTDGGGGRQTNHKNKKPVGKKNVFWCLRPSRELTAQPNQEGPEGRPLDHVYLRKGSTISD